MQNINEPFDEILKANVTASKNNIAQMPVLADSKAMFEYLQKHSPHVDIGTMYNALIALYKKVNPNLTKDELSKNVYGILKYNIKEAKDYCFDGNETIWTECENLK